MKQPHLKTEFDLPSDRLRAAILSAHDVLEQADDVSPRNGAINAVLNRLFAVTTEYAATEAIPADISQMVLHCLRRRMAQAEEAMEYFWSNVFFKLPRADYASLEQFLYWNNYHFLVNAEKELLRRYTDVSDAPFCFVGSGPLPISQLIFQRLTGRAAVGIDLSLSATCHAQRLVRHLGMENCAFQAVTGQEADYSAYDCIFIASLIDDKDAVIEKIKKDRGDKTTFMLVRSAEKLHELYYEPYQIQDNEWRFLGQTPYRAECINTTLLYRLN